MTYEFDPELAVHVPGLPRLPFDDLAKARALEAELAAADTLPDGCPPLDVHDTDVPGGAGRPDVPVRLYLPSGRPRRRGALLYLHPGGFALGGIRSSDVDATLLAAGADVVVLSVDYRLAPEHPFPSALVDCAAALRWLVAHADALGVDPDRIGLAGESAGGNIAAALALLNRDHEGPAIRGQFLFSPVLDDRLATASATRFTDTPFWDRANAEHCWDHYLGGPGVRGGRSVSAYAAPARAADLAGLPPVYLSVCEYDPARDEALAYGLRLLHAGVRGELHLFPGTFHASTLLRDAAVSVRMSQDRQRAVKELLRPLQLEAVTGEANS
ncbi:alpha/beta hydrolase [Streptomyces sp. NPDC047123]|uniref:alpha/beta hydrolase n=1 Tax=Streptomyces sp. NPDC047123 TaxID=3155622 RepID=UPI00340BD6E4